MKSQARKTIDKVRGKHLAFGEMIASLRKADEISQVDLAKRLHISTAHLCDIEKGRRYPSLEKAIEFARIMEGSGQICRTQSLCPTRSCLALQHHSKWPSPTQS